MSQGFKGANQRTPKPNVGTLGSRRENDGILEQEVSFTAVLIDVKGIGSGL